MLVWLSVWSEVQIVCILSCWCHCILPFWYRLTQVVLEKRQLSRRCSSLTVLVAAASAVLDVMYAGCRARNFITYNFRFCLFYIPDVCLCYCLKKSEMWRVVDTRQRRLFFTSRVNVDWVFDATGMGLAPGCWKQAWRAICSASVSYLFIFNHSSQTNYLKIYQIDLRRISRVGRTIAANGQPEISFFDPSRDVAMATNFC